MLGSFKLLRKPFRPNVTLAFDFHGQIRLMHTPVRVRFAPSPTGYLHLGGLRTALFNYLLAKKTGGQFILRIEDTDQTRYVPGATEKLMDALSWAGIQPDEGPHEPYYQSKRTKIYQDYAEELVKKGHAYRCFCTHERLLRVREARQKTGRLVSYDKHCSYHTEEEIKENLEKKIPFTIRLDTPEGSTNIKDTVYGNITFNNKTLDDTILIKSDGFPTYHLANVVDDHLMGITHVLRGEEWMPSTPKHVILYKALGWTPPQFVHLPLLMNADKTKLSKRSGDVHVEQYIEKGYLPEALNNFVALLGWNPNSEEEVFSSKELIEKFDLNQLNKSNAIVDIAKLDWMNKQHLLRRAQTPEGLESLVDLLQPMDRIRNIHDIPQLCSYYFVEPDYASDDAKALYKKLTNQAVDVALAPTTQTTLGSLDSFDAKSIKQWIHELAESNNIKQNHLMMAMRYAVTGTRVGAGVAETMEVLGRRVCLDRLANAIKQ
ncbi:glutamyl-tRNA synthetase [Phycomyces nitens]|nr:glutamyl-tRNA synthetase [Phycomyces nitens]